MEQAEQLLRDAQSLVERGWTQHAEARDRFETEVDPWEASACSWSLLGALVAAVDVHPQLDVLAAALHELAGVVDDDSLAAWNDRPTRVQQDVVGVLAEAARTASLQQPLYGV